MPQNTSGSKPSTESKDQQELVRKVANRVWELWREDLRRERERRGSTRKG